MTRARDRSARTARPSPSRPPLPSPRRAALPPSPPDPKKKVGRTSPHPSRPAQNVCVPAPVGGYEPTPEEMPKVSAPGMPE